MNPSAFPPVSYRKTIGQTGFFCFGKVTNLGEKKIGNLNQLYFIQKLCHILLVTEGIR